MESYIRNAEYLPVEILYDLRREAQASLQKLAYEFSIVHLLESNKLRLQERVECTLFPKITWL